MKKRVIWAFVLLCGMGCTGYQRKESRVRARLEEISKQLTTAMVDVLAFAPTNRPTEVARDLAQHNQQVQGLPMERLDAKGLISGEKKIEDGLQAKYDEADKLNRLKAEYDTKLQAMGAELEKERNKSIVRRIWSWATGTLGVAGIIAACVFCPALIPILGRILGWMVGKVPSLAGAVGVVGKDAFDAVVTAVQNVRAKPAAAKPDLDNELARETDRAHKRLITVRKASLGLKDPKGATA
jgi:hypothetical protein